MTPQDVMQRERYFTRHTRGLLWLEFVLGGLGLALLLFGRTSALLVALGLGFSLAGLLANIWRNVQRFRLMDEFEQLTLLKGVGAAFIVLMALAYLGGFTLLFAAPKADAQLVAVGLLMAFLLGHIVLSVTQSRLTRIPGESA
ncbi:MAG: hypothetical protein Q4C67_09840 [Deinococcus sp.]|nr:hypothetical protein [Deinococcus sp.]